MMLTAVVEFVEAVYRETGVYPIEVTLPLEAWAPLRKETEKICRVEQHTPLERAAIVLSQGTKVRIARLPNSEGSK